MSNDMSSFQINESKAVLIAGNGPSLAQIDYDRLPKEFDVFRCNQFYLEEQYFVGKKIKATFFHCGLFFEQQATLHSLQENKEYECEHVVCSDFESFFMLHEKIQEVFRYFPNTINAFELYRKKLPRLASVTLANALFKEQVLTTGVIMALTAVAMGYRKIYIAGIDLYANNQQTYVFDIHRPNLVHLVPDFKKNNASVPTWHSAQTDITALQYLQELYDVEIYSVSPTSPLSEYFPLAPKTGFGEQNCHQLYFPKSEYCLKDIVVPQSSAYQHFRNKYHLIDFVMRERDSLIRERDSLIRERDSLMRERDSLIRERDSLIKKQVPLKNNIIYRLVYDLLHLPSHIKKYLRHKYQNK